MAGIMETGSKDQLSSFITVGLVVRIVQKSIVLGHIDLQWDLIIIWVAMCTLIQHIQGTMHFGHCSDQLQYVLCDKLTLLDYISCKIS